MIEIVNITRDYSQERHDYEVRINRDVIARFQHYRDEGISVLMRNAAEVVDRAISNMETDLDTYRRDAKRSLEM